MNCGMNDCLFGLIWSRSHCSKALLIVGSSISSRIGLEARIGRGKVDIIGSTRGREGLRCRLDLERERLRGDRVLDRDLDLALLRLRGGGEEYS